MLLLNPHSTYHFLLTYITDSHKTEVLRGLDGAKERLHLFKANLVEERSFDSAVEGCQGVFHTASPVIFSSNDPQADIIDPAVKGTLDVLRSCAKVHSIKRLVFTSSVAAIVQNGTPRTLDLAIDETWFTNSAYCKESKKWYPLSKTLAEEAAWKLAKENGIDLIAIHPGAVISLLLQPILNFGAEILKLINGGETFPSMLYMHIFELLRFPRLAADIC
ncbi:cinnamoyl-CoA reductase 1-like [Melia azedarach]|uniref:Cinnamoyl-CoA reductase 1-like n=1 Tax=Melia azedarach TaxID=155640 RepID=A0ACC1XLK8_MELAZ|nr:cinnamoyl-CoA reductase 1-like [Melia azedarach]